MKITQQPPTQSTGQQKRNFRIKDNIRQGGVLSILQYALLVDEINKEVHEKDLVIEIPDITTKLACLLWMDDVLLLETRPKEKQELMDTTDKIPEKYHFKFGKEKSLSLTIGKTKDQPKFSLGPMVIEPTDKY